jgi:hypothetical protein
LIFSADPKDEATMSYLEEFSTVDLIVGSTAETRGVDAFALSLIKAERQIRRLMTHLVYQFPCFRSTDIEDLRGVLANVVDHLNPRFLNFERKIDKETSVIFCAVGTEFSSFIHLL